MYPCTYIQTYLHRYLCIYDVFVCCKNASKGCHFLSPPAGPSQLATGPPRAKSLPSQLEAWDSQSPSSALKHWCVRVKLFFKLSIYFYSNTRNDMHFKFWQQLCNTFKPKTSLPGGESNPGASVLEADLMTTLPRRHSEIWIFPHGQYRCRSPQVFATSRQQCQQPLGITISNPLPYHWDTQTYPT
jgi:hypothetical protein